VNEVDGRSRPSSRTRVDLDFIVRGVLVGFFIMMGLIVLMQWTPTIVQAPADTFPDTRLYFRATEAWVNGENPWEVVGPDGIEFAAPPPALLLNLPLLPLGVENARLVWIVAGAASWLFVMRRLHLPPWWLLFTPFLEAYLAGTADVVLVALILVGGSGLAAIAKPYSVPALIADGRYRGLVAGLGILLVTVPILPWGDFIADLPRIRVILESQAGHVSAWGNPPLMLATAIALVSLGRERALWLLTPTMWPSAQLHYSVFSTKVGAPSAGIALALTLPGATAPAVIIYAIGVRLGRVIRPRLEGRRREHAIKQEPA
jgi:hypothetical protein